METLKFKTNIKCGSCIATVTPSLNNLKGVEKWEGDTTSPDKILAVQIGEALTAAQIMTLLKEKGYNPESFPNIEIGVLQSRGLFLYWHYIIFKTSTKFYKLFTRVND